MTSANTDFFEGNLISTNAIKVLISPRTDVCDICDAIYGPWMELGKIVTYIRKCAPENIVKSLDLNMLRSKKLTHIYFKVIGKHRDTAVIFDLGSIKINMRKVPKDVENTFVAAIVGSFMRTLIFSGLSEVNIDNPLGRLCEWIETNPTAQMLLTDDAKGCVVDCALPKIVFYAAMASVQAQLKQFKSEE